MPVRKKAKIDPIPESFPSPEAAGEFWDSHDLGDYWDQTRPVKDVTVAIERRRYLMALEPSLANKLQKAARERGITAESLIHLWLSERLQSGRN
jgi:hypothetical protein